VDEAFLALRVPRHLQMLVEKCEGYERAAAVVISVTTVFMYSGVEMLLKAISFAELFAANIANPFSPNIVVLALLHGIFV
jgi:hypothetical protein